MSAMPDLQKSRITHSAVRPAMRAVAERITLPLKTGLRRTSGNVPGAGAGSSIDFQDHRPYVPGDDPRHIDWQAYARSGLYSMKLYREEVRPLADIVLDTSASMFLDEAKTRRTMEIAWFCVESALRIATAVRLFSLQGGFLTPHEAARGWEDLPLDGARNEGHPPHLSCVPWRAGSLRILISDLLFPAEPGVLIPTLLSARGRAILFVPGCAAESDPDWLGNTELLDCEGEGKRDLRFHSEDLRNYGANYRNHFGLWRGEARRHGVPMACLAAEIDFLEAMTREALPAGAVEMI